jgi:hypothetical protein
VKNWKGFERTVAKMVVDTFKDRGITNKDCYRTPMSGGHRYASKTDAGDLVISPRLRKMFSFNVECKCYATVNLAQFLVPVKLWKKSWKCNRWLAQVTVASEKQEGEWMTPLLIFKENNGEIMAAFPFDTVTVTDEFRQRLVFQYEGREWIVVRFKTFLRKVRTVYGS